MVCANCGRPQVGPNGACVACGRESASGKPEIVQALESALVSLIVVAGLVTWLLWLQVGYLH